VARSRFQASRLGGTVIPPCAVGF